MNKVNYLTAAYDVAKKDLPADGFEFDKLWKIVAKHLDMKQETFKNELLGDFYTDLLQDGNFVFLGDNIWILRENIAYEKYQKIRDSITDNNLNLSDAEYGGYAPEEMEINNNDYDDEHELENSGAIEDEEAVEDDYDTNNDDLRIDSNEEDEISDINGDAEDFNTDEDDDN